jgi:hypothetical protein
MFSALGGANPKQKLHFSFASNSTFPAPFLISCRFELKAAALVQITRHNMLWF